MLDLWRLDELRGIALDGDALVLGALTTYTEIRRSPLCREHLPALVEAAATIGAAQIQNRGTLGGNIANASPAGDTLPVLLAPDAEIVVGWRARRADDPGTARSGSAYRKTGARARRAAPARSASRSAPGASCASARSARAAPRRSSKVVLALAWRDDGALAALDRRPRSRSAPWPTGRSARAATEAVLEGADPRPGDRRPRRRSAGRRDQADRRRPLDGRLPSDGRRARPPSARPRRRRLVIDLAAGPAEPFEAAVAPLFEGAPRSSRGSPRRGRSPRRTSCSTTARSIAHAMPEAEQIELVDAHPRLGAPPGIGVGAVVRRAGLRPRRRRRGGRDRARPRRRGAGAPQRRVRGAVRLPLLRLRGRPAARCAPPRVRGRARTAARRRSCTGRSMRWSTSRSTGMRSSSSGGSAADAIELGANRYGKAQIRLVTRRPRAERPPAARPHRRDRARGRVHGRRTSTATTSSSSRPTR